MTNSAAVQVKIPTVLDDPGDQAVAQVYADAFLNTLPGDKAAEALLEFRSFVEDVLNKNPEFAGIVSSATVSREDKVRLIDRVLAGRASDLFVNFLRVLARHERLDLLPIILRQFELRHEIRSGQKRVQVTSAKPLSDSEFAAVREQLKSVLPFEPIIETAVDPEILGGLRIRVGDTVYDGSLRGRLKQLRHRLRERSLNEIQSGRNRFSHSDGN